MKSVKGTQTEKNLIATFAGESQARMRYTFWAKVAFKEGYEQIGAIFLDTADNEKAHAKRMFQFLEGGEVEVAAAFPAGVISTTENNLNEAAQGEEYEYGDLYPKCADTAEKEGFPEIAAMYRAICVAEQFHAARYRALQENMKTKRVFQRETTQKWHCRECGYIHEGTEAPQICPSCQHPQAFYEIAAYNY